MTNTKFPLFTLITITLNNFSGLQKTFKSIEKQTFDDFQWLVIDGGSTDKTIDFLREHRSQTRGELHPFTFTSEPDDGIYDAMNKGIKHARGQYLLFLNAGDELASPDILEVLGTYTDKKPDFICGDSLEPTPNNKKPTYKAARRYKDIAWGMITHHQSMLYDRHLIRDKKLHYSLLYKIAGDYDFTVRFLKHAKKITYIPKPICIFEQGGISQTQAALGRKEQYIIREKLNMVSQPKNLWILIVQSLSWRLKNISPALYQSLKRLILKIRDHERKPKKA